MSRVIGACHENQALTFLKRHGLQLITRNYACRLGEIDLIMRDGNCLVFVEVRYRQHRLYGGSSASVTSQKQQRLIRAAQLFLQLHPQYAELPCRFDLIAIDQSIEWLQNSIYA